jgi:hypothetical protein
MSGLEPRAERIHRTENPTDKVPGRTEDFLRQWLKVLDLEVESLISSDERCDDFITLFLGWRNIQLVEQVEYLSQGPNGLCGRIAAFATIDIEYE